jgi:hypothetical protein
MRYVQAKDGAFVRHVYDVEPTQWDNDNFCRVRNLTDEQVVAFGVSKLCPVTPPSYDRATQTLDEGDAVLIDGAWCQNWVVSDLETEAVEALRANLFAAIRTERNAKLSASDWTQLPDAPVDALAWAEYRQALRDITDTADPFAVVWPDAPKP